MRKSKFGWFYLTETLSKRTQKAAYTLEETMEACTRRDSDYSDEDASEVESEVSEVDSIEKDMFLHGADILLDA